MVADLFALVALTSLAQVQDPCDAAVAALVDARAEAATEAATTCLRAEPMSPRARGVLRAQWLLARAERARRAHRLGETAAYELRVLHLVRKLAPEDGKLARILASRVRAAYVELATDLLDVGRARAARRAFTIARYAEPRAGDVATLERALEEAARAAYLRGYSIYRDGGLDALRDARRFWAFARSAGSPEGESARRADAMMEETTR